MQGVSVKRFLRPKFIIPAAIIIAVLLAIFLYLFQPWKLFTTVEVYEPVPTSAAEVLDPPSDKESAPDTAEEGSAPTTSDTADASPLVLEEGKFISHEHSTSGTVKILQLSDGSRVLRLENLETSDGPQLEVWLTDAPVIDGVDGWTVFDDGKHVSLGALKGNVGNQNYMIPNDLNLDDFTSVSIWCARFHVSFGAAELTPTNGS